MTDIAGLVKQTLTGDLTALGPLFDALREQGSDPIRTHQLVNLYTAFGVLDRCVSAAVDEEDLLESGDAADRLRGEEMDRALWEIAGEEMAGWHAFRDAVENLFWADLSPTGEAGSIIRYVGARIEKVQKRHDPFRAY